jgi:hypothetical protein
MGWFLLGFIAFPITLMVWATGSENNEKRKFEDDVEMEMRRIIREEKEKQKKDYETRVREEALKRLAEEKK